MSQQSQANADLGTAIRQDHELVQELFSKCESGGEAGREAFDTLVRVLAVHETAEEEVLYPTVRSQGGDANEIVRARLAEEDEAKTQLSELEKMGPDAPEFKEKFRQFKMAVLEHAQHEEQEVLPLLASGQEQKMLQQLGSAFMAASTAAAVPASGGTGVTNTRVPSAGGSDPS